MTIINNVLAGVLSNFHCFSERLRRTCEHEIKKSG